MNKTRPSLLAAALTAVLACVAPASAADTAQAASGKHVPLLWKVSDADNSLYLLGSIHVLKKSDYPLSTEVDAAFDDAEHVMFEVDLATLRSQEAGAAFGKYAGFADGRKLSDVLSADTLQKLDTAIKAGGASLAQIEGMEPWALSLTMLVGVVQALGFEADAGVDQHIDGRARAAGKSISALETLDEQFGALDGAPMSEQVAGLTEFLNKPADTVTQLKTLHEAWLKGDAALIDKQLRAEMAVKSPHGYQLLNVARNDAWVPKLEARLNAHGSDDTLAVVGALHLLGEDGVVEKLRAKGYKVERVCSACSPSAGNSGKH
jgi:uncharacterized protein